MGLPLRGLGGNNVRMVRRKEQEMKNHFTNVVSLTLTMALLHWLVPGIAAEKVFWAAMAYLALARITDILTHLERTK